ncbi:MAG: UDP-N-acetylmuramate dehydrogenase [Chloroflexi bacterium]|nr:UDP-N-acetylmuramate dehydrogenase [Chloroflexota bacterium]
MIATLGVRQSERLAGYSSLKVGGPAEAFLAGTSIDELVAGLRWAREHERPVRVIGGGSNLLIADSGVRGLVMRCLSARWRVEDGDVPLLVADAGAPVSGVARALARRGFAGFEWAATVPGTVGGAVVNNAGAFGGCMADCLASAWMVDAEGVERQCSADDLDYAYRASILKRAGLGPVAVTRAAVRLQRGSAEASTARIAEYQAQRTRSQPRQRSAGSVFANPPSDYAGRLIEAAGLKGTRRGGAQISTHHANFILNLGQARAREVYELVQLARTTVGEQFGVWLRPEIELFGEWTSAEREAIGADRDG